MVALRKHNWTEAEYLAFENASETKHELYRGEVYDMAGASPNHLRITGNAFASLHRQLRERPCEVFSSELRVRVSSTGTYTYPDIVIACEPLHFTGDNPPALLNPTVIVEVLSPSTEDFDRNEKLRDYIQLDSLQDYILIAQDRPQVEHWRRGEADRWMLTQVLQGLASALELPSIGCTLALAEVYAKVTFDDHAP